MGKGIFAVLKMGLVDAQRKCFSELERHQKDLQLLPDLRNYNWSKNPLKEWSRCVEYPLVANIINELLGPDKKSICDFGSGISFLPSFLSKKGHDITCYDIHDYSSFYTSVNETLDANICFKSRLDEEFFDLIYSISVIEHTERPLTEIQNIYDKLKPGGKVIITLDIDVRGDLELSINNAFDFCSKFNELFESINIKLLEENTGEYLTFSNSPFGRKNYSLITKLKRRIKFLLSLFLGKKYFYDIYDLRVALLVGEKPR